MGDRMLLALKMEWLTPAFRPKDRAHALLWLFVPGAMWMGHGRRRLGRVVMAAWLTLGAVHVMLLGETVATSALILACGLHSVTAAAVVATWLAALPPLKRCLRTALYAVLIAVLLYSVVLPAVLSAVVRPITVWNDSLLIRSGLMDFSGHRQRGDWIAYQLPPGEGYVITRDGLGFDRILALPGETVRFHEDAFEVNGRAYERVSPHMPVTGEITVPAGHYFIWPANAAFRHVDDQTERHLLLKLAMIAGEDVRGAAYHRWFWRTQVLRPLKPVDDWTPPVSRP